MTKWWQPSPKSAALKPVPWLAPAVIAYLEGIVQPDFEVLEHGSGGSTLWFAAKCRHVTAYENDPDWQKVVKDHAPENVGVFSDILTPPKPDEAFEKFFDLLLIDGIPVEKRRQWLTAAPQLVKPGGWIVLDNANRPEYAAEREALKQHADLVQSFDSNEGGTLYLVTDFYRVKGAENETGTEPEQAQQSEQPKKRRVSRRNTSTKS